MRRPAVSQSSQRQPKWAAAGPRVSDASATRPVTTSSRAGSQRLGDRPCAPGKRSPPPAASATLVIGSPVSRCERSIALSDPFGNQAKHVVAGDDADRRVARVRRDPGVRRHRAAHACGFKPPGVGDDPQSSVSCAGSEPDARPARESRSRSPPWDPWIADGSGSPSSARRGIRASARRSAVAGQQIRRIQIVAPEAGAVADCERFASSVGA